MLSISASAATGAAGGDTSGIGGGESPLGEIVADRGPFMLTRPMYVSGKGSCASKYSTVSSVKLDHRFTQHKHLKMGDSVDRVVVPYTFYLVRALDPHQDPQHVLSGLTAILGRHLSRHREILLLNWSKSRQNLGCFE